MKIKTILASMLAVAALAACTKDDGGAYSGPETAETGVAYLSIRIETEARTVTRGSDEDPGVNESDLNTLYILTFKENGDIIGIPDGTFFIKLTGSPTVSDTPDAFKVSALTRRLLVIANAGPKLQNALANLNGMSHFSSLNMAISDATRMEVSGTDGFTMINSGDEEEKHTPPQAGDVISEGLIVIASDDIKNPTDFAGETDPDQSAIDAAQGNRVEVRIERLASKIEFTAKDDDQLDVANDASFKFGNWTVDGVNSKFYPWAEKTLLSVAHISTPGTAFYAYNFYTADPNYYEPARTGIKCATIDGTSYQPVFYHDYGWMDKAAIAYNLENTMTDTEQKYGAATRIVVKGTYTPDGFTEGNDWYSFGGIYYETFDDLKTAYNKDGAPQSLRTACESFYAKVRAFLAAKTSPPDLTNVNEFTDLTQALLSEVVNANGDPIGGEVAKQGATASDYVIRWHQDGLSYYYYEIRHDNSVEADNTEMAFGKYGIVRNNWYKLTLGSIKGPGTPWYPDIDNPGPGDPDPEDPIDASTGYLGITISVAPWIIWTNEIGM